MKRALLTGASAGIGRALAERLVRSGYDVVNLDRDAPEQLLPNCEHVHLDLAQAPAMEQWLQRAAQGPAFDLVVHNAGISCVGPFESSSLTAQREVLRVNLRAPLRLTQGLLHADRIAPQGQVVFLSSLSHPLGYPGASVYAATKDGLTSYARSLSVALAPRRILVLTVFPGPVRTAHARRYAPPGSREDRRMLPQRLAEHIERALQRRRRTLFPGLAARAAATLGWLLPGLCTRLMRRALYVPLAKAHAAAPPGPDPGPSPQDPLSNVPME